MGKQLTSRRRAHALSTSLFFVGLAIVSMLGTWWPGMMLVIGIPMAIRQFLMGRSRDAITTLFIFGGIFAFSSYDLSWDILLPILFIVSAFWILGREFLERNTQTEADDEENLNHELEEK